MNEKTFRNQVHQKNEHLAVPLIRYSGSFFKCRSEELRQMDEKIRKQMTIHIRKKNSIDYMCQKKKEEEDTPALKIT